MLEFAKFSSIYSGRGFTSISCLTVDSSGDVYWQRNFSTIKGTRLTDYLADPQGRFKIVLSGRD